MPALNHLLYLVCGGEGVWGGGKAEGLGTRVVHGVVPLQEGVAINEVETLAGLRAQIANDEVDRVSGTTDGSVEL